MSNNGTAVFPPNALSLSLMEAGESSPPLKYKTWALKVFIHCEACKKKVKRVLQSIDGVFTTNVDSVLQKVTVTGDVDAETLIRKLQKTGKHAELWPNDDKSGKKSGGKGGDSGGKNEKGSSEKADEGAAKKPNGGSGGKGDEDSEKKPKGGGESKETAAEEAKPGDGAAKKRADDEKPAEDGSPPDGAKAAEDNAGTGVSAAGSGKKKGKKGKGNGGGNGGSGTEGNAGGHPPATSGAPPSASKDGCGAVIAPAVALPQYPPPLIARAPIGWNQWTPAVGYSMVTPAMSYEGSYSLPPYVDASFMVPYSSGGVVRYVPPGCYPQREEEYDDVFGDENATGCSVM